MRRARIASGRAASPPIEVRAGRSQPLGMTPAHFLRDYWQKRPLLIRGAFPQFHKAITAEDLAGLACEEMAMSRIVLHDAGRDRYTLRNGPFSEADFAKLPKRRWTLLVQDVDKWDMDVAALLDSFRFVPSWRVDDVMISYAVDGGGVGAHVDNYDVFLVQGVGSRRWRISTDPRAPTDFRADADLKLLRSFEPTHDWLLAAGDALYLPPGVPHEGVAQGACMTFSIGMRAPSRAELLLDLAEFIAESADETQRYGDRDLAPVRDTGEIDDAALARVAAALPHTAHVDKSTMRRWFGTFITRYRNANDAVPTARPVMAERLVAKLPGARLLRNPWSRFAWSRVGRGAELYVAGQHYACSSALARLLTRHREIGGDALATLARGVDLATIAELVNAGHLRLLRRR